MHCKKTIVTVHLLTHAGSPKFRIFGHLLFEANSLEIKDFDTKLVFIYNAFNSKSKVLTKHERF